MKDFDFCDFVKPSDVFACNLKGVLRIRFLLCGLEYLMESKSKDPFVSMRFIDSK